jgi:hypothetical protein
MEESVPLYTSDELFFLIFLLFIFLFYDPGLDSMSEFRRTSAANEPKWTSVFFIELEWDEQVVMMN